jgi:CMP/dCMP kinase
MNETQKEHSVQKIIIAIDGYSSCGKSTLAKQLAKELNYTYIDSGAMYRGIAVYFLEQNLDMNDHDALIDALQHINLSFDTTDGKNDLCLNGENVEAKIRTPQIANLVSPIATIAEVREKAVHQQQEMGRQKGIVMDGRDIGTTVFPDASLKIFMTGSLPVRAHRRFLEMQQKNTPQTLLEVEANLIQRDHIDSTREISPLRKADDAILLDNSNITPEQQLALALQWALDRKIY